MLSVSIVHVRDNERAIGGPRSRLIWLPLVVAPPPLALGSYWLIPGDSPLVAADTLGGLVELGSHVKVVN